MIELQVIQGSQSWLDARRGIPTASQFSRIVTPTGKLSTQREQYLAELLAAYFVGEEDTEMQALGEWVERGTYLEPQAIAAYAFLRDAAPRRPGLCYHDESRTIAASPDWLIDPDGCGEVKCPMARQHLMWLARGVVPSDHFTQVQGQLWVTGRAWCDFVSFCPGLPMLCVRMFPEEGYQAALSQHLPAFVRELGTAKARLISQGVVDPWAEVDANADREWFEKTFGGAAIVDIETT